MLVVGLAITGFGTYDYLNQSEAMSDAVAVDATVTGTEVDSVSQRRGGPDYRPVVTYEYTYDGASYTSRNRYPATFEPDYETRSAAEAELQGYERGEPVTAYVNPDAPSEAFLVKETSSGPLKLAGIGGVIVVVGGVSILRGLGLA